MGIGKRLSQRFSLDRVAQYQVCVAGRLGEEWAEWLGPETQIGTSGTGESTVTSITGPIDQAALHGMLRRLYDRGFPLISVSREEDT